MSAPAPQPLPKPTPAELEILNILWDLGQATVRQVHEILYERKKAGYTTVLKLLQIMTEKRLVRRDVGARAHIYEPCLRRETTQGQIVDDLLDKVFGGSAAQLVMRALSSRPASKGELDEIRRMLDEHERGQA